MREMRIFIGVIEVAGYYGNLAFGLRKQGYRVTLAGASSHLYQYESDNIRHPFLIRIYDALLKTTYSSQVTQTKKLQDFIERKCLAILTKTVRVILFFWALQKHDVFIFGFGLSFLPNNWDLPILKLLKKKVICNIAHGSEARPPYINGAHIGKLNHPITANQLVSIGRMAKEIKNRCLRIEKYADVIVGAPLTSHFLEKPFVNTFYLGVPFKELICSREEIENKTEEIRILHCPSNPVVKGTSLIRKAIRNLKDKGYSIEFIELIGKPNKVVLEELRICDFVVDQAYSDFPMAGFATEAAWFAKPAVVGGYGWQSLKQLIPSDVFPPSHLCHPDQLESAIEKLIVDRHYRCALGRKACEFVESTWSIQKFTDRYLQLIHGDIPEDWLATPGQIPYIQGCGISEDTLLKVVSQLLQIGKDILQLRDKPSLERVFIDFCDLRAPEK